VALTKVVVPSAIGGPLHEAGTADLVTNRRYEGWNRRIRQQVADRISSFTIIERDSKNYPDPLHLWIALRFDYQIRVILITPNSYGLDDESATG